MGWYRLLKYISIAGGICSIFITIIGLVLIFTFFKGDKYMDKTVEETPLLKYIKVLWGGVVLTIVFQIVRFVLRFFE